MSCNLLSKAVAWHAAWTQSLLLELIALFLVLR